MINKFFTILAAALSISAFVYIYNPDKKMAMIIFGATVLISILLFYLEHVIKQNGSKLANAFVFYFTKNGKYIVKEKTFVYEQKNAKNWEAEKKYTIESRCNALEEIEDKFNWSAKSSEEPQIIALENGQKICRIHEQEKWTLFTIRFNRSVSRRKSIYTGAGITNLIAEPSEVKPFLAAHVDTKTRRLKMIAKIPAQFKPINAKFSAYIASSATPVFSRDIQYEAEEESFIETIEYPRKKWRYVITWEYGNDVQSGVDTASND